MLSLVACQATPPASSPVSNSPAAPSSAARAPTTAAPKAGRVLPANTIDAKGIKSARLAPKGLGPPGPLKARSTSPAIYLRNLEGRKIAIDGRVAQSPNGPQALSNLAAWHMEKQLLDGDPAHADAALAALDKAVAAAPADRAVRQRRAGVLAHLHRFADAKADLEHALKADPTDPGLRRALGKVLENLGDYAAAKPHLAVAPSRPTYQDVGDAALRHFKNGNFAKADHTLRLAAATYRDVHPIPLAWLDFQRGLIRLRTGKWADAKRFFEVAYRRLPSYYVVTEHLAEVEAKLGNHARALQIYDEVVANTNLPEFIAARAGVLDAMGRAADAKAALDAAEARWEAILAKHGPAYAVHAVGFWLDDRPNPAKARKWADANLALRRDANSLVLAARAHAASGAKESARTLLEEALPNGPNVDEFHADVADVLTRLGDADGAAAAMAKAKALNPKAPNL